MKHLRLIMACLFCGTAVSLGATQSELDTLIARAQSLDEAFRAGEALAYYQQAEAIAPDNASVLIGMARMNSYLMSDAVAKDKQLKLGQQALQYAQRAVQASPRNSEAHLALAVCLGKLLPLQDTRQKLESSRAVKEAVDKALALDPNNDLGWHLLGRWHQELAGIGGARRALARLIYGTVPDASYEESARCLEKALALNPQRLMHAVELGRTYAMMRREDEARKLIAKGLGMPNREKDDPETKERGRRTLESLGS